MTTPTGETAGAAIEPLWTDENIVNDAQRASSDPTIQAKIRACLCFMRHGYEHHRATATAQHEQLQQRVVELEAQVRHMTDVLAEYERQEFDV